MSPLPSILPGALSPATQRIVFCSRRLRSVLPAIHRLCSMFPEKYASLLLPVSGIPPQAPSSVAPAGRKARADRTQTQVLPSEPDSPPEPLAADTRRPAANLYH